MFSGERLRADLRDLQRLYHDIRSWIGDEAVPPFAEPAASKPSVQLIPSPVNWELLQSVHQRTLLAVGLLLHALETARRPGPGPGPCPPSCDPPRPPDNTGSRWVFRPQQMRAAQLVALLWEQVCRADMAHEVPAGSAPPTSSQPQSRAAQTTESGLRRCEACCIAESAVKALVEVFCREMESPAVASQRSAVTAGLCSVSQWGAMRALTAALCDDLDTLLQHRDEARRQLAEAAEAREQAVQALHQERQQRQLSREDTQRAHDRARQAIDERDSALQSKLAAESRLTEMTIREQARLQEVAHLREALEAARSLEGDLRAQLQASRAALEEAGGKLQQLDGELQLSRRQGEALQAEQTKLRKQVKLAQERHALLLRYPDLHGPIQPLQHEAGDPVLDMECQVRANEMRMSLLTSQNERLRATIAKLRLLAASGRPPTRNHSRPTSASSPSDTPATSNPRPTTSPDVG